MSLGKDFSLLPPSPPSQGRAEKLAQADLAHGIDLRRCFFPQGVALEKKKKGKRETKRRMEEKKKNGNPIHREGGDECIGGGF